LKVKPLLARFLGLLSNLSEYDSSRLELLFPLKQLKLLHKPVRLHRRVRMLNIEPQAANLRICCIFPKRVVHIFGALQRHETTWKDVSVGLGILF
jgi:hypothetical protein